MKTALPTPAETQTVKAPVAAALYINNEEELAQAAEIGSSLAMFVEELNKVDTQAAAAKLNETTISDNNGGRILL